MAEVPFLCNFLFLSCGWSASSLYLSFLVIWLKCLFSVPIFSCHVADLPLLCTFLMWLKCLFFVTFLFLLCGWTEVPLLCTFPCSRGKCCSGRISSVVGERAVTWSVEVTSGKWCCCCGVAVEDLVGDCRKEATAAKEKFSKYFAESRSTNTNREFSTKNSDICCRQSFLCTAAFPTFLIPGQRSSLLQLQEILFLQEAVLRIRDVYPGSRILIFFFYAVFHNTVTVTIFTLRYDDILRVQDNFQILGEASDKDYTLTV